MTAEIINLAEYREKNEQQAPSIKFELGFYDSISEEPLWVEIEVSYSFEPASLNPNQNEEN